jgi:hypothetical protein
VPAIADFHFRVFFRNPETAAAPQPAANAAASSATQSTNPSSQGATNSAPPRPRPGGDRLIADLEFKAGILTAFKWDN